MGEIRILHVSDIHFRKSEDDDDPGFREEVQEKMLDTIEAHVKENDPPQFVAITGDIAFSGKKEEYDAALAFVNQLKATLPEETYYLVVPGNHDVDRKKIKKWFSIQENIVEKGVVDDFLIDEEGVDELLSPKFSAFREFAQALDKEFYPEPEDYFWVKPFEEHGVAFLGLNSSWACERKEERFKIALGHHQLREAMKMSEAMPVRIALMHHPHANWLKDMEPGECRKKLFYHCDLLLHGHGHQDLAEKISDPANPIAVLGANASYTRNEKGFIGFQFISVIPQDVDVYLKVWPYIFDEIRERDFVPDYARYSTQKGKEYFELFPIQKTAGPPVIHPAPPLEIPEGYRQWIEDFHSNLPINQLAKKGEVFSVPLPKVYIPLDTSNPEYQAEMKRIEAERKKREGVDDGNDSSEALEPKTPATIDIETLLSKEQTLLLRGGPGMGKTTLVRHIAYSLVFEETDTTFYGFLPVIVFLKDFWPVFEEEYKKKNKGLSFMSLLPLYMDESACNLDIKTIRNYLSQDRAIFLIDGLDEVPEHLRKPIVESIARFRSGNRQNRFLITGRPHGIDETVMRLLGDYLHDILPLNEEKIETFIVSWFKEICNHAGGEAKQKADGLIADIRSNEKVEQFIENPLLLTAICILYQDNKKLPDQRADLYGRVVDNLLCKRFTDSSERDKPKLIEDYLMQLAFSMQTDNLKNIEASSAKDILKEFYKEKEGESLVKYNRRIDETFEKIEPQCGLLKRLGSGDVEFFHLTFQEFMAAKYMVDNGIDFKEYLPDPWWQETVLLYAGIKSMNSKKDGNNLVRDIFAFDGDNPDHHHRVWLLGATALKDMLPLKREQEAIELSREKLKAVIEESEEVRSRFKAGKLLGVFGDHRFEKREMVEVPEGPFIRGSKNGEEWERERPAREICLDTFWIGKNPVTNGEFKEFIEKKGYETEEFWLPEGWDFVREKNISEPGFWNDREYNGPNVPVVGVSWYEADAFCRWLRATTGENYRLPTEAEWEKAARGTEGRIWPWGDRFESDLCNSAESGLFELSAVGIFPKGNSPYGCLDMAGNVFEWCQDWFDEDYYNKSPEANPKGPEIGECRVMRGGGWFRVGDNCRCAYRYLDHPEASQLPQGVPPCQVSLTTFHFTTLPLTTPKKKGGEPGYG